MRWRSGILHLSLALFRPYLMRWADEGRSLLRHSLRSEVRGRTPLLQHAVV